MIEILHKKDCCGCGACAQSCPVNCITMVSDTEGFLYPRVDKDKCINCNKCNRVCPVQNADNNNNDQPEAYVAMSRDKTRLESSSGGLFYLLAKEILSKGGAVAGAAFDDSWLVRHDIADNPDDLSGLLRSKYMQSNINKVYTEVKKLLDEDKSVLFTGTGCQVSGLKAYLGKPYDNLYTIDVLCHGAPSPQVWRCYLNELEEKYHSHVTDVNFRNKVSGWKDYSISISFENGETYSEVYKDNSYMKLFLSNYILRPSCHSCKFKSLNRCSDLTLGDAWGIGSIMPEFDDDGGTSLILAHTNKGKKLIEQIREDLIISTVNADDVLPPNADSRKSVDMPYGRAYAFHVFTRKKSIPKMQEATAYNYTNRIMRKIIPNKDEGFR